MKITIERADLLRALTNIDRVVEKRNTVPILGNVLIEAAADHIVLRGTDLEVEISAKVAATCDPGSTTVDCKALRGIVAKVTGDNVSLDLDGESLIVKSGRSRFKLPTLPAGDMPSISGGEFPSQITATPSELFPDVFFAAGVDDTRYQLNGVYLHKHEGELRAVAADGHRLAYKEGGPVDDFDGIILPRKIVGILSPISTPVAIEISTDKLRVKHGDTTIVSRLVELKYVDYVAFWPKGNPNILSVDRAAMRSAVERVGLVGDERMGKGVRLSMAPGGVLLTVNGAAGESSEEVEATYTGEPMDVGYQLGYLAEILGHVPGDTVEFAIGEGPGTNITGADGWAGVLMKFRI